MRYHDVPRELNLAEYFLDRRVADRVALRTDAGPMRYGELRARVNRAGHALRDLGVRRGDRVLLALRDGVDFVAAWYGAQRIGAVTAEVSSYLPAKDYRYYLDYAAPAVVLADASTVAGWRAAGATRLALVGCSTVADASGVDPRRGEHDFDAIARARPAELDPVPVARDDVVIWKFTTGSTGAPKACMLPARSPVLSFAWYARGVLDIRPDDVVLPVPKLFFGYARDLAALYPFGVGASGIVFPRRSTADEVFRLITQHRPTILVNVPTMMNAMVRHPDAARQDLGCLRLCTSAGEALPPELHRRWLDTFGVEVVDGLGSSEMYHIYVSNRPGKARPGSLGRPVPGYRVRVVDGAGAPVPDGDIGRMEIVGETAALGYWRAEGASAETFTAPHTVRSGDLVSRDSDGYFHYRGRADDLLKVRGRWVAPAEIENCLSTHPAVLECAVVGCQIDGLTWPRAFVVCDGPVPEPELRQYVRSRLAAHKCPRDVWRVHRLPRTESGKIDRRALAKVSIGAD